MILGDFMVYSKTMKEHTKSGFEVDALYYYRSCYCRAGVRKSAKKALNKRFRKAGKRIDLND